MLVTPSLHSVSTILQDIWCRIALDGDDDVLDVLNFGAKVCGAYVETNECSFKDDKAIGKRLRFEKRIALDGDDDVLDVLDVLSFRAK
nr:hypothetical protein [Tanacetum cinerariifolium]